MMWMSFVMDGNKQEEKLLFVKHKALKWIKTNNVPQGITLMGSQGRYVDYDIAFIITMSAKQGRFKCMKCTNKRDAMYDVFTYYTKFLKYDPS